MKLRPWQATPTRSFITAHTHTQCPLVSPGHWGVRNKMDVMGEGEGEGEGDTKHFN